MSYKYYLKTKENENFEYSIHTIECKENLPEDKVLALCQKIYPQNNYVACGQLNKNTHVCKYCGWIADGADDDLLCSECRMDFGHAFYSEL